VHSLSKHFYINGSDLEYVSEMCDITPLKTEMVSMQRKFHRKLFDLAASGWRQLLQLLFILYLLKCSYCKFTCFSFCLCLLVLSS